MGNCRKTESIKNVSFLFTSKRSRNENYWKPVRTDERTRVLWSMSLPSCQLIPHLIYKETSISFDSKWKVIWILRD
jgi:hypothetical protein